jgi:hypothetical protein
MNHFFFIFILLSINEHIILMFQTARIISNKSYNIEEYGTVKFDCTIEKGILAAWRVNLRHDDIYRYSKN